MANQVRRSRFQPPQRQPPVSASASTPSSPLALWLSCAGVFRLNSAPMTSSLFEPNTALLERYNGIEELCRVVSREDVTTATLDSLKNEMGPIDWLKIDVQGGELAVIEGATELLKNVVRLTAAPPLPSPSLRSKQAPAG